MLFASCLSSNDQTDLNSELVIAANWQQLSAEYDAYFYQVFNGASDRLVTVLANLPPGSKPAIITDINDTLISNTSYFSSLVGTDDSRSNERSLKYWQRPPAQALPGAKEFLNKASQMGIEIFYISGRFKETQTLTFDQLQALGFPIKSHEFLLLQNTDNTTLSKEHQRQIVKAKGYDIIMMVGDQLSDFAHIERTSTGAAKKQVLDNQSLFGSQWFLLPNVVYGQWAESEEHKRFKLDPAHINQAKMKQLQNSLESQPDAYYQHIILADLWIKHSAEFTATALQTFNLATEALYNPNHLADDNRAIIMDIDGTIIQYPPIHLVVPLCRNFETPEEKTHDYMNQFNSPTVPGAVEFLKKAQQLGYEIFYITARHRSSGRKEHDNDLATLTMEQLRFNHVPINDADHLLTRESFCPDNKKNCDKSVQREAVKNGLTSKKRISKNKPNVKLYIGDYLNDFDLAEQGLSPLKKTSVETTRHQYGRQYFLIPNPVNKTWMRQYYSMVTGKNICKMNQEDRAKLRTSLLQQWPD